MAMPLGRLCRTYRHCFDGAYVYTKRFASNRRASAPLRKGDQLHVKSFFEKQKNIGKNEEVCSIIRESSAITWFFSADWLHSTTVGCKYHGVICWFFFYLNGVQRVALNPQTALFWGLFFLIPKIYHKHWTLNSRSMLNLWSYQSVYQYQYEYHWLSVWCK